MQMATPCGRRSPPTQPGDCGGSWIGRRPSIAERDTMLSQKFSDAARRLRRLQEWQEAIQATFVVERDAHHRNQEVFVNTNEDAWATNQFAMHDIGFLRMACCHDACRHHTNARRWQAAITIVTTMRRGDPNSGNTWFRRQHNCKSGKLPGDGNEPQQPGDP